MVGLGAEGPGAEEGGHRQQQLAAQSDGSRRWRNRTSSRMLRRRARGQAVGPQADDHPALEHGAVRVRGVAEPGVGPRAVGDGHALAVGGGLGAELPELGRVEVGAVGDQPVGVAELAPADVVGGPGADRLPVVVPGAEVFEEVAERAVAVLEQLAAPRASRPGGSRAAAGWPRPCGRASPTCCRGRAGSGPAGRRRRPGPRGGPSPSQSQASSLGLQPAIALQADQLGEDDRADRGRGDLRPSSGRRSSCRPAASSRPRCRPRRFAADGLAQRSLASRSAAGRSPGGARRPRPPSRPAPAVAADRREFQVGMGVDEPGHDRHVAQVEVGRSARRPGRPSRSAPAAIVTQAVRDRRPLDREDVARREGRACRVSSRELPWHRPRRRSGSAQRRHHRPDRAGSPIGRLDGLADRSASPAGPAVALPETGTEQRRDRPRRARPSRHDKGPRSGLR